MSTEAATGRLRGRWLSFTRIAWVAVAALILGLDAARTLEAYASGLREETDLEQLSEGLVSVVEKTVQPEHVSLWLREPDRGERK